MQLDTAIERAKSLLEDTAVVESRRADMIAELTKVIDDAQAALVALGAKRRRKVSAVPKKRGRPPGKKIPQAPAALPGSGTADEMVGL